MTESGLDRVGRAIDERCNEHSTPEQIARVAIEQVLRDAEAERAKARGTRNSTRWVEAVSAARWLRARYLQGGEGRG